MTLCESLIIYIIFTNICIKNVSFLHRKMHKKRNTKICEELYSQLTLKRQVNRPARYLKKHILSLAFQEILNVFTMEYVTLLFCEVASASTAVTRITSAFRLSV